MAQTHQGGKFSICTTSQSGSVDQAAFEALTYVQVPGVITAPSFQTTDNILTQNPLDSDIAQKQKGFRDIETSEVVVAFNEATQAGHAAMIAAARSKLTFAVKYELDDQPSGGSNPTTTYAICKIGGGGLTGGGGEDFVNRVFQLSPTDQFPIEVEAS